MSCWAAGGQFLINSHNALYSSQFSFPFDSLQLRQTTCKFASRVAQSLGVSNSAACMLENGYMFLKYVLSQGLGELAAGHDSRNEPQSNALLRTTLRLLEPNASRSPQDYSSMFFRGFRAKL